MFKNKHIDGKCNRCGEQIAKLRKQLPDNYRMDSKRKVLVSVSVPVLLVIAMKQIPHRRFSFHL